MFFPVDPLIPNVVCVLQYQFKKITGIFDDGRIKVQIVKIKAEILEKQMGMY